MAKKKWFQAAGLILLCHLTIAACQHQQTNKQTASSPSSKTQTSSSSSRKQTKTSKTDQAKKTTETSKTEAGIPGVTVPTSDGFILTDQSKILTHTKDGIVVDHNGHSHFIFYADLEGTKFAHLIPAGTKITKPSTATTASNQPTDKQTASGDDHHYTFNPADIVAEDALGYTVRHGDHYHYILKSSLATLPTGQTFGGNSGAGSSLSTSLAATPAATASGQPIAGLDYPTSDGFLFDGSGIMGWTDLGLMVDHGGHLHLILKSDLANSKWAHLLTGQTNPTTTQADQPAHSATPVGSTTATRPGHPTPNNQATAPKVDEIAAKRAYLAAATGLSEQLISLINTPQGPAFLYPHEDHNHVVLLSKLDVTKPFDDGHGTPTQPSKPATPGQAKPVAPTTPVATVPNQPAPPATPQVDEVALKRAYLAAATGLTEDLITLIDTPNGQAFMYPHGDHSHLVLLSQIDVNQPFDDGHGNHDHSEHGDDHNGHDDNHQEGNTTPAPTQPAQPEPTPPPAPQVDEVALKRAYLAAATGLTEDLIVLIDTPNGQAFMYPHGDHSHLVLLSQIDVNQPFDDGHGNHGHSEHGDDHNGHDDNHHDNNHQEGNTAPAPTQPAQPEPTPPPAPQVDEVALKRAYLAAATGLTEDLITLIDTPNGQAFMYPHGDHSHLVLLSQIDVNQPFDDGHGNHDHSEHGGNHGHSEHGDDHNGHDDNHHDDHHRQDQETGGDQGNHTDSVTEEYHEDPVETTEGENPDDSASDATHQDGEETGSEQATEPTNTDPAPVTEGTDNTEGTETTAPEDSDGTEPALPADPVVTVPVVTEPVTTPITTPVTAPTAPQVDEVALKRTYLATATGLAENQILLITTPEGPAFMYPHGDHHHVVALSKLDVTKPFDDGHGGGTADQGTQPGHDGSDATNDQPGDNQADEETPAPVPTTPPAQTGFPGIDFPTSDGFLFDGTGMAGWTSAGLLVDHNGHLHILPTEAIAQSKWAHLLPNDKPGTATAPVELSEKLTKQREDLAKQLGLKTEDIRVITVDGKVVGFEYPHEDHTHLVPVTDDEIPKNSLTAEEKRELTAYIRKTYGLLLGTPVTFHEDFVVFAIPHPHQDYDVNRDYYSDVLDPAYDPGHVHPYAVPLSTLSIPKTTDIPELDFENELILAAKRIGVAPSEVKIKDKKYFVLPGKDHDHYLNILTPVAGLDAYMANKLPDIKANFVVGDYSKDAVVAEADRILAAAKDKFGDGTVEFRRVARALEAFKANLTVATTSTEGYVKALQSFENKHLKGLTEDTAEVTEVTDPVVATYLSLTDRLKGYDDRTLKNFGLNAEQKVAELKRLVAAKDEAGLARVVTHFNAIDRVKRAANDLGPRLAYMDFFVRNVDSDKLPASLRQEVLDKLMELQKISGLYRNPQKFMAGLESTALLKEKVKVALAAAGPAPDHANWTPYPRGYDRREIVREINSMRDFVIKHKEVTAEELAEGFNKPLELFKDLPKKPTQPVTPPAQPTTGDNTGSQPTEGTQPDTGTTPAQPTPDQGTNQPETPTPGTETTSPTQPEETQPGTTEQPTETQPLPLDQQHDAIKTWLNGLTAANLRHYSIDREAWVGELDTALANNDQAATATFQAYQAAIERVEKDKNINATRTTLVDYFLRHIDQPYLDEALRERLADQLLKIYAANTYNFKKALVETVELKVAVKSALAANQTHPVGTGSSYQLYLDKKEEIRDSVQQRQDWLLSQKLITAEEIAEGFGQPYPPAP